MQIKKKKPSLVQYRQRDDKFAIDAFSGAISVADTLDYGTLVKFTRHHGHRHLGRFADGLQRQLAAVQAVALHENSPPAAAKIVFAIDSETGERAQLKSTPLGRKRRPRRLMHSSDPQGSVKHSSISVPRVESNKVIQSSGDVYITIYKLIYRRSRYLFPRSQPSRCNCRSPADGGKCRDCRR